MADGINSAHTAAEHIGPGAWYVSVQHEFRPGPEQCSAVWVLTESPANLRCVIQASSMKSSISNDPRRGSRNCMLTGNFTDLYFMLPTTDLTHNTQQYFDVHTITVTNTYGSQTHLFTYTCKITGLKILLA